MWSCLMQSGYFVRQGTKVDLTEECDQIISIPQQSHQFCDKVGELTVVLRLFLQMFRLSKSRHRLFILSQGKVKKHSKNLLRCFLGFGE